MYADMGYLWLIVITLVIGLGAQALVNSKLKKYSHVPNSRGITGAQAASQMLAYYGINNVVVRPGGAGQDFFDPRTNSITLSPSAYSSTSVTALATACHEVGHACQFAFNYTPMKVRSAIVPVVNLASNVWMFILIAGALMGLMGLVWVAVIMYAAVVIFQLVTLPVEFNASHRAMTYMKTIGLPAQEQAGSFDVLRACAFTYVAAALTSILQLLWILGNTRD